MFYELLKSASYAYFSLWQLKLHLMTAEGHISYFFMMFDDLSDGSDEYVCQLM